MLTLEPRTQPSRTMAVVSPLLALRDKGCALLIVSEELDELFEICDRLVVIAHGRVSPSIASADATTSMIGVWMSGLWGTPAEETEHAQA